MTNARFQDGSHVSQIADALWSRSPVGTAAVLVGAGFSSTPLRRKRARDQCRVGRTSLKAALRSDTGLPSARSEHPGVGRYSDGRVAEACVRRCFKDRRRSTKTPVERRGPSVQGSKEARRRHRTWRRRHSRFRTLSRYSCGVSAKMQETSQRKQVKQLRMGRRR